MRKTYLLLILVLMSTLSLSAAKFVLVLDAGHGGSDPGAVGAISYEKNIVLDIIKRLGRRIEANNKDIKVVYTRKTDKYVSLVGRAKIANDAKADLFISLHVDDVDKDDKNRKYANGITVFTLGNNDNERSREVAKKENYFEESHYSNNYQGIDPNSMDSDILFDLIDQTYSRKSIDFARMVQKNLKRTTKRRDRGVSTANLAVLRITNMPSVLVEFEFMCNPKSEKYVNSEAGKNACVDGLYNAIIQYVKANKEK